MNFTRAQVAAQCVAFGGQVGPLPDGVDGSQLLWAMAGTESSFGADCTPRHEPAFDVGGAYGSHVPMPALLAIYGSPAAACSYGPLQVMLCNAGGLAPSGFDDIAEAFHASVTFLNQQLRRFKPQSLAEVAEIWNSGSIRPDPAYVAKLTTNYAVPIPSEVSQ